jgi:hypothetical protein
MCPVESKRSSCAARRLIQAEHLPVIAHWRVSARIVSGGLIRVGDAVRRRGRCMRLNFTWR